MNKTPNGYYKWYPRDFATSITVRSMSFVARAIYRELLDIQFENERLTSVERLLNVIGATAEQWSEFEPYFEELFPNGQNPRMKIIRDQALNDIEKKQFAGKMSAEKRASQVQSKQAVNKRSTPAQRVLNKTEKETENIIDININNSNAVQIAWREFVAHRREIKHPLTMRSATAIVKKFAGHSDQIIIDAIERSIINGWRDVFFDKIKSKQTSKSSATEQVARLISEMEVNNA